MKGRKRKQVKREPNGRQQRETTLERKAQVAIQRCKRMDWNWTAKDGSIIVDTIRKAVLPVYGTEQGILYGRRVLSLAQKQAADEYQYRHARYVRLHGFPSPHASAVALLDARGGANTRAPSPALLRASEGDLRSCERVLTEASAISSAVHVIIHQREPFGPDAEAALVRGCNALAKMLGLDDGGKL